MSVLMFTSSRAGIPNEGNTILTRSGGFAFTLILALGLAINCAVVSSRQAQRPHPGPVRQADDRATAVRRHVHLPAAEGQPRPALSRSSSRSSLL